MQTLADIGEDALVRRLIALLPQRKDVIAGPGDDCAVVHGPGPGRRLILKTDTIVEGVHFTHSTPPRLIGRKAMARVISDFAAMAATPAHALVTLIAPSCTPVRRAVAIYEGMRDLADEFQVSIVGGETSRGGQLIVTVSLSGSAPARGWLARNRARAGDVLWVTGRLGGSIGGHHLRFQPRMAEAHWLAAHTNVRAMMDLSDGLGRDLPRLATACGLSFQVDLEKLPRRRGCTPAQAWGDGEDYELLFATPARAAARLAQDWTRAFPAVPLTRIGTLLPAQQAPPSIPPGGWQHFQDPAHP